MKRALGMQTMETPTDLTAPKIARADAHREARHAGADFLMLRLCV